MLSAVLEDSFISCLDHNSTSPQIFSTHDERSNDQLTQSYIIYHPQATRHIYTEKRYQCTIRCIGENVTSDSASEGLMAMSVLSKCDDSLWIKSATSCQWIIIVTVNYCIAKQGNLLRFTSNRCKYMNYVLIICFLRGRPIRPTLDPWPLTLHEKEKNTCSLPNFSYIRPSLLWESGRVKLNIFALVTA